MQYFKKPFIFLFISVVSVGALIPASAAALSCLSPTEHIPMIVEEGDHDIFEGEITATTKTDGNVTEVQVAVTRNIVGEVAEEVTLQYEYHDTWAYLCVSEPGEIGETEIFIVRENEDSQYYVTHSFEPGSWFDDILSDALSGSTTPSEITSETENDEASRTLMQQVINLLEELLSLLQNR